jgi:hypothetical protein
MPPNSPKMPPNSPIVTAANTAISTFLTAAMGALQVNLDSVVKSKDALPLSRVTAALTDQMIALLLDRVTATLGPPTSPAAGGDPVPPPASQAPQEPQEAAQRRKPR